MMDLAGAAARLLRSAMSSAAVTVPNGMHAARRQTLQLLRLLESLQPCPLLRLDLPAPVSRHWAASHRVRARV